MTHTPFIYDYMGGGLAAALPVAATLGPLIPAGSCAFYFATDTNVLYRLAGGDVAWQVAAGGASSDFVKIASHTCGVGEPTVTFAAIPATYSHLKIVGMAGSVYAPNVDSMYAHFNGDAVGGHYTHLQYGLYSGPTGFGGATGIAFIPNLGAGGPRGSFEISIPDYLATEVRGFHGAGSAWQGGVNLIQYTSAGYYNQAVAITDITLGLVNGPNFSIGSKFTLYGLK